MVDTILHIRSYEPTTVISVLTLITVTIGIGVALWFHNKKVVWDNSEAYLNKSIDLIEKSYDVLLTKDNVVTNNRVPWVTSARLISRAKQISNKITEESHKNIYISERDYFRHKFHELLRKDGNALPAAFFCGITNTALSVTDAVVEGSGNVTTLGTLIPSRVISIIYDFKSYHKGYVDPIGEQRQLTDDEIDRLDLFDQNGVSEYLIFLKNNTVFNGKIYPKQNGQSSNN